MNPNDPQQPTDDQNQGGMQTPPAGDMGGGMGQQTPPTEPTPAPEQPSEGGEEHPAGGDQTPQPGGGM